MLRKYTNEIGSTKVEMIVRARPRRGRGEAIELETAELFIEIGFEGASSYLYRVTRVEDLGKVSGFEVDVAAPSFSAAPPAAAKSAAKLFAIAAEIAERIEKEIHTDKDNQGRTLWTDGHWGWDGFEMNDDCEWVAL